MIEKVVPNLNMSTGRIEYASNAVVMPPSAEKSLDKKVWMSYSNLIDVVHTFIESSTIRDEDKTLVYKDLVSVVRLNARKVKFINLGTSKCTYYYSRDSVKRILEMYKQDLNKCYDLFINAKVFSLFFDLEYYFRDLTPEDTSKILRQFIVLCKLNSSQKKFLSNYINDTLHVVDGVYYSCEVKNKLISGYKKLANL